MYSILALSLILGIAIGSFLNVVIYRLPRDEKVTGRSACPTCGHQLSPLELIPIASYLKQKGKCKSCGQEISNRYIKVEILTGLAFMVYTAAVLYKGFNLVDILAGYVIIASLVSLSMIDLDTMIINDRFHVLIVLSAIAMLAQSKPIVDVLIDGTINGLLIAVPLFIVAFITLGLGLGDVKLMFASGFLLGAYNSIKVLLIGSLIAIIVELFKRTKKGQEFPFGPYLALGMYIVLVITMIGG